MDMKKTYHAFESCLSIASHEVVWEKMKVSSVKAKIQVKIRKIQRTNQEDGCHHKQAPKFFFQKAKVISGDQSVPTLILQVILEEN